MSLFQYVLNKNTIYGLTVFLICIQLFFFPDLLNNKDIKLNDMSYLLFESKFDNNASTGDKSDENQLIKDSYLNFNFVSYFLSFLSILILCVILLIICSIVRGTTKKHKICGNLFNLSDWYKLETNDASYILIEDEEGN